jgi:hypothetical protein
MSAARRPITVVLDGSPTPAWQARALQRLVESDRLSIHEVSLVPAPPRGRLRRLHAAIERRLFYLGPDALGPVVPPERSRDDSVEQAGDELVVWLSEQPPPDDRRALLHLRHAQRVEPAEDAILRAVLGRAACIESEAVLCGSTGDYTVVERTVSELRSYSVTLSLDLMLWKLADLVARAAERSPGLAEPVGPPAPSSRSPSIAALFADSISTWPRVILVRLLFQRPWSIRVRRRLPVATEGWRAEPEQLVRWTRGHLYADPFLFEHEGLHHLFCEHVLPGTGRGVISHTELRDDGGPAASPQPVLECAHHLSYPFVFVDDGEIMMIPGATTQPNGVELYRAVDFPVAWQREAVLLETLAPADVTLLWHRGRIWLFATVSAKHASSLDELHLFSAEQVRGPWLAHPMNPVVSDARCARPAGAIQRWGERLVRPAQDGSRRYGGAIAFCEIDVLDTNHYAEHEIARLTPADVAGARATHTYNSDASYEAIDLRTREPRLGLRLHALLRRAG